MYSPKSVWLIFPTGKWMPRWNTASLRAATWHLNSSWRSRNTMPPAAMLQHTTLPLAWNGWLAKQARRPAPTAKDQDAAQNIAQEIAQEIAQGPRYDLMFMAMNAAVAGLGIALLPDFMAVPLVSARRLTRLSIASWQAPGGYYLAQSPLMRSDAAFATFRDWLRHQIKIGTLPA
jgi:LysR family transcriptional regulator, glycine cleavage system transcriptional activator